MRDIHCRCFKTAAILLFVVQLYSCKKEKINISNTAKMAGNFTWIGTDEYYDKYLGEINKNPYQDEFAIIVVNDSTIVSTRLESDTLVLFARNDVSKTISFESKSYINFITYNYANNSSTYDEYGYLKYNNYQYHIQLEN